MKWQHHPEKWTFERYSITHVGLSYVAVYELTPGGAYIEPLKLHSTFDEAKEACEAHRRKQKAMERRRSKALHKNVF